MSRIFHKIFLSVLLAFFISSFSATPTFAVLEVKREVLSNGLTLLVAERHNLPLVKVSIGIKAGSLMEPEEKAGLANLTAGLLAGGTKNRTAIEISEEIEFVGGGLGAGGGDDYITVTLSVLKKDIELGFDLLSDIILNPIFPEEELIKKKVRVKGGLKASEDDPGYVASKKFKEAVFGNHPYGRLVRGTAESLDRIEKDDLHNFHSSFYLPNSSIMSVVGDITDKEVKDLLKKFFSEWQNREVSSLSLPVISDSKSREIITIDRDLTQANVILGHIGVEREHPDYYALSVMNYILGGGGFASRLMQNIREDRGLVYDIHSYFSPNKYGGGFQVGFQTKNESANTAIEETLKEVRRIRTEKVSDLELSDAKSFLTGSFPLRIETSSRIASFLIAVEFYGLGLDYMKNYPGYINGITREDILRVAKQYLDPENFILVVVADQDKAALKKEW